MKNAIFATVTLTLLALTMGCESPTESSDTPTPKATPVEIDILSTAHWVFDLFDSDWKSKNYSTSFSSNEAISVDLTITDTVTYVAFDGKLGNNQLGDFDSIAVTYNSNYSLKAVCATDDDKNGWEHYKYLPKTDNGKSNRFVVERDLFEQTWGSSEVSISSANVLAFSNEDTDILEPNCAFNMSLIEVTLYK